MQDSLPLFLSRCPVKSQEYKLLPSLAFDIAPALKNFFFTLLPVREGLPTPNFFPFGNR